MRNTLTRLVIALVVSVMTGVVTFAVDKSGQVTFNKDIKVNGTTVKKGTYDVKFDNVTSELTISDKQEVVVRTRAKLAKVSSKSSRTDVVWMKKGSDRSLHSITLSGDDEGIIVASDAGSPTAAAQ